MPRPKSYDRDQALKRACDAFWQYGYTGLGVRGIEEKTGLNQFAIRTEFGGKEGLYLEALKLYADYAERFILAPLKAGGVIGIAHFFGNLVNATSPASSMWGCLIVNLGVESAKIRNPRIAIVAENYWHLLNTHFSIAIQHAKDSGELVPDLDVIATSNTLVIAVMGIHTMNRISRSPTAGAPMAKTVQKWIESWRR